MRRIRRAKLPLALCALVAILVGLPYLFADQAARLAVSAQRVAAGLEPNTVDLGDMHIAYLDGGRGETLVLLHGIGGDKDHWTRVSRHLTPHYRVVAVDLPGFGESSKPSEWRYRAQDQVERLRTIVQALGLKGAHWGGSSMGGFIAASYAARYPDDVASLWLVDPAGVSSAQPSEMIQRIKAGEPIPLFAQNPDEFDAVFRFVMTEPPYVPTPIKRALAERAAANYQLNEKIFMEIMESSPALETFASGITVPTRIVWGEEDRVLHPSGAQVLTRLMPNASALILPGIGHLPMIEAAKPVAEDYRAFRATLR